MKTYMSDKRISLVGRVWEIRRYLKMAQHKLNKDTSLLAYLSEQTNDAPAAASFLLNRSRVTNNAPNADNPMPHPPQFQFLQNKPDLYEVPYPSWK
jgi:hypothetical protein